MVHLLDSVLMPPTVLEEVAALGQGRGPLSALVAVLDNRGPATDRAFLSRVGTTFFAPSNRALSGLDPASLDAEAVDAFVRAHLAAGVNLEAALASGARLRTLGGIGLTSRAGRDGPVLLVPGSSIPIPLVSALSDIRLRDGVLHVIEGRLDP